MWLFFLLLFPKKPVLSILDSLLTNGINLSDSFLVPTSFSFYHIINFFILFSISYKVFKSFKIDLNDLSKRLFLLFSSLFSAALISAFYYNLYLSNFLSTNYLAQFDYLLHIYEGLIFSIVIWYYVFIIWDILNNSLLILVLPFNALLSGVKTIFPFWIPTIEPCLPSIKLSTALTPNWVPKTLSKHVGVPPLCIWPKTETLVSYLGKVSSIFEANSKTFFPEWIWY